MTCPISGNPAGWKRSRPAAMPIVAWTIRHTGPSGSRSLCPDNNESNVTASATETSSCGGQFLWEQPSGQPVPDVPIAGGDQEGCGQACRQVVTVGHSGRNVYYTAASGPVVAPGRPDCLVHAACQDQMEDSP